jgi:hypothetical protein
VASLASLHLFVKEHRDETITVGDKQLPKYPHIVACLDGMIDQARADERHSLATEIHPGGEVCPGGPNSQTRSDRTVARSVATVARESRAGTDPQGSGDMG